MTKPLPNNDPDRKRFLLPFVRVVARSDSDLRGLLDSVAKETAVDIARLDLKTGIGATVRRNQFLAVQGTLAGHLASLWSSAGDLIQARRNEALQVAIEAGQDWDRDLLLRATDGEMRKMLRRMLKTVPQRNFRNMLARYTRETIPLSQKVYQTSQLAKGWVDQKVNSGLGRGLSARELAKEVRDMIRSDVKGGVSYAAMRLARTEINAANKFASEHDNAEKPFVESIEWRLSKSHPFRDICDVLAAQGPYPKDEVPDTPHPQCFCYQVPKVIDEDEFVKNLQGGSYDKYLAEKYDIGDELPAVREEVALASVAKVIDRQPEPEQQPAALKARRLDSGQAAWHASRLLKGEGYEMLTQAEEDRLNVAVRSMLLGMPEKKVAALKAIRVGGLHYPGSLGEYWHPPDSEIRLEMDLMKEENSVPAINRGSDLFGYYSRTGVQSLLQASLNHEMGHHLDLGVGRRDQDEFWQEMDRVEPNWLDPDESKGFALNKEWIVENIGTYAATNERELLAELYAEYRGESKAKSELAKFVGEWFSRDIGEQR